MRKILLATAAFVALSSAALPAYATTPAAAPTTASPTDKGQVVTGDLTSTGFTINAKEFNLLGGKNDGATSNVTGKGIGNVNSLAANLVRIMLVSLSLLCVVLIVAGGIMMATAAGEEDKVSRGKTMLTYSLIGLFVALSSYAIVSTVSWTLGG